MFGTETLIHLTLGTFAGLFFFSPNENSFFHVIQVRNLDYCSYFLKRRNPVCCFLRLIQKRKNIDIRYITTYCFTTEYFEIESSIYLRQYSDYIQ